MKRKKGFTLIELLVVIAIIGILASIVMVTFPGATRKAKDSRIVAAIAQIRTILTYIYANEGSWPTTVASCTHDEIDDLCADIKKNNPEGANPTIYTGTKEDEWCIFSGLNEKASGSTPNSWYCAAGNGKAGFTDTDPSGSCNSTTFDCPTLR